MKKSAAWTVISLRIITFFVQQILYLHILLLQIFTICTFVNKEIL